KTTTNHKETIHATRKYDPIAVVGIGCRLPMAPNLPSFWNLLKNGQHAIHTIDNERWASSKKNIPSQFDFIKKGGFLDKIDAFDASFFGISAREAAGMDPQQRLLLEVAWETFEHACIAPKQLAVQPVGVFVGISSNDYS